jgi:Na+/H+ antiporter NhaD/arsenite permease-like protein
LAEPADQWRFEGLGNLIFLGVILAAVFVTGPPFLREGLMVAAALGSYFTTAAPVHEANHFNFHPIQEVAILFVGIFATMMPALDWLQANSGAIGEPSAAFFYWASGTLSSVLDNAPTYLSFLKAVSAAFVHPETIAQVRHLLQSGALDLANASPHVHSTVAALQKYYAAQLQAGTVDSDTIETAFLLGNASFNRYIVAVSVGAVFFGANTYIGNGPNFMVKSIAEHQKVHTPGFLGYIFRYTLPLMVPMLLLVWWLFFS